MFESAETKRRIRRLETTVRAQQHTIAELCRHTGVSVAAADPYGVDDEERRLIAEGKTIHAIKHHRERTGSGLREAKEIIDAAAAGA